MLGKTATLSVTRPHRGADGRDDGTTTTLGPYHMHIQYYTREAITEKPGLLQEAVLTAEYGTDIAINDRLTWDSVLWRVRATEHTDGMGRCLRVMLVTVKQ